MRHTLATGLAVVLLLTATSVTQALLPPPTRLSPAAVLGRRIFFDPTLSASGKLACASCHDPSNAYAAPKNANVVMSGGNDANRPGLRTVPSLRYIGDTPLFTRHAYTDSGREREDIGPAGGFMLDGRALSLVEQVKEPLLDPAEMGNSDIESIASRLRHAPYAGELEALARQAAAPVGTTALVEAASAAIEHFELEDDSFHPYSSRFDQFLRGTGALSADEIEGLRLFNDPSKGNCNACHTSATGPGGRPPVFTDYSYHALGLPRNPAIAANGNPQFFDMGLCGPKRVDMREERQYCGYFKTPGLRNVARRHFFFHNGRFTTLQDVMHFYVERDTNPGRWYPTVSGKLEKFDDLPKPYRPNVDTSDAPLNRERGQAPALNEEEIRQIIAFLGTLTDED